MSVSDEVRGLARRAFLYEVSIPKQTQALVPPTSQRSRVVRFGEAGAEDFLGDAVCTIGAFDGVHKGHRFLFSATIKEARERGAASVIVTFDPDPDELFCPRERVRKLLNNEDRMNLLTSFGADAVFVVPFTRDLAAHNTDRFMNEVLGSFQRTVSVHVGSNFCLGAGNAGNVEVLTQLGKDCGFEVHGHSLRCADDAPLSATRIRDLVASGQVEQAADYLCRPHFLRGQVVQGRHEGRVFGFPTANVRVDYPYVLPAEGVYSGLVEVNGRAWPAAINVGIPRTFAAEPGCAYMEANMLGFSGDIYDAQVGVAFTRFLRPQQAFASQEELIATVMHNIDQAREELGDQGIDL